jgi:hypothetical protein
MVCLWALVGVLGIAPSTCPTRNSVGARVAPLVEASQRASTAWNVEREGERLRVTLLDARGDVLRERWISGPASCERLEEAAAVVVAAWLSSLPSAEAIAVSPIALRPKVPGPSSATRVAPSPGRAAASPSGPLAEPETPKASAPERTQGSEAISPSDFWPRASVRVPSAPPEDPALSAPPILSAHSEAELGLSGPGTATQTPVESAASLPPSPASSGLGEGAQVAATHLSESSGFPVELGLDLRGVWAGSVVPGLGLRFDFGRSLGGFVEAGASTERRDHLGSGYVVWQRSALALGARWRWTWARWFLESAVGPEVAVLVVRGEGFKSSTSEIGLDASVCAQLSGGVRSFGPFGVRLGARGCLYPVDSRAGVTGVEATYRLPRGEVGLGVGLYWANTAVQGPLEPRP